MEKKEKEQAEKLRRFLDAEPGAEPPEDAGLLRVAQMLDAGAPEGEENASRRRVWAKVAPQITAAPPIPRRWSWRPALVFSGAAVAVVIAATVFGAYLLTSSSSTASAEEIVRKAQAVAADPSAGGVESYEMNLKSVTGEGSWETHIWHQAPNLWRIETDGVVSVGDGTTVWNYFPDDNLVRISSGRLSGPEPAATGLDAFLGERIQEGNRPVLLSDEKVAGRDAYVVALTVPKGDLTVWVDKETYFVLRSVLRADVGVYSTEATLVRYNDDFSDPMGVAQGSPFTFTPPEGARVEDARSVPAGRPTPPPGPLPTPQPAGEDTSDWTIYRNDAGRFELRYPTDGTFQPQDDGNDRIDLPFVAGTNLSEKYALIAGNSCAAPFDPEPLETGWVDVNGVAFLKEVRSGVAAGNAYDSVTYSTERDGTCVTISFVLHSVNPGNFPSPIPTFNRTDEPRVFDAILSTFAWTE